MGLKMLHRFVMKVLFLQGSDSGCAGAEVSLTYLYNNLTGAYEQCGSSDYEWVSWQVSRVAYEQKLFVVHIIVTLFVVHNVVHNIVHNTKLWLF